MPQKFQGLPTTMVPIPQQIQRAATQQEIDEVHTVRALQIRTEAVKLAAAIVTSGQAGDMSVIELCRMIAAFIGGEVDANDNGAASLLPE